MEATVVSFAAQYAIREGDLELAWQAHRAGRELAERSGAKIAWYVDTGEGDLALASGQGGAAARAYLRSMTAATARRERLQVQLDLQGFALALAIDGRHEAALEAVGLADAEAADLGAAAGFETFADFGGALDATRAALDRDAAAAATARGRAVPAGQRVEHAATLVAVTAAYRS